MARLPSELALGPSVGGATNLGHHHRPASPANIRSAHLARSPGVAHGRGSGNARQGLPHGCGCPKSAAPLPAPTRDASLLSSTTERAAGREPATPLWADPVAEHISCWEDPRVAGDPQPAELVCAHVSAFNERDLVGLLDGLSLGRRPGVSARPRPGAGKSAALHRDPPASATLLEAQCRRGF